MSRYFNSEDDYLEHYGVQGMKWGIRRYVDDNGRLTAEGKKRYGHDISSMPEAYRTYQIKQYYKNSYRNKKTDAQLTEIGKRRDAEIEKHFSNSKNQYDWDHRYDNDKSFKNVNDFYDALESKYNSEISGVHLRDLGYEDTKAGRDFMKSWERQLKGR